MEQELSTPTALRTINVSATEITDELPADEARAIVQSIKEDISSLRARIYILWKKKGWKSLGYESWEAFMAEEFSDLNRSTVKRQVAAGQLEEIILAAEEAPAGARTGVLPEWVLRPLNRLKDDADKVLRAWRRAVELALKEGKKLPTGPIVEKAVKELFEEEEKASWPTDQLERREIVEGGGTVLANMHKDTDEKLLAWARENEVLERIDRKTVFGNPYEMPDDGDRDEVCDAFPDYFRHKKSGLSKLSTLNGKVLACWCYPERCHGEHLISLLEDL